MSASGFGTDNRRGKLEQANRNSMPTNKANSKADYKEQELSPTLLKDMDANALPTCGESTKHAPQSLTTIPGELIEMLVSCMSQQALHALARTSSKFVEIATRYLYREPIFASTYRFAQFAYLISRNSNLALLVCSLDLSNIPQDHKDEKGQFLPSAGWREFRHRYQEMYPIPQPPFFCPIKGRTYSEYLTRQKPLVDHETLKSIEKPEAPQSFHPPPSPLLRSQAKLRDVPIGMLCHVLAACRRLKYVDLSDLTLTSDAVMLHKTLSGRNSRFQSGRFKTRYPTSSYPTLEPFFGPPGDPSAHPWFVAGSNTNSIVTWKSTPAACTSPLHIFDSEVIDVTWKWIRNDIIHIFSDEIVYWLCTLPELEELRLRKSEAINDTRAQRLVKDLVREGEYDAQITRKKVKGVRYLDLRESGSERDVRSALVGSREEVEKLVTKKYGKLSEMEWCSEITEFAEPDWATKHTSGMSG